MSVTLILVIITSAISLLCLNNPNLFASLKHYPVAEYENNQYYRWLTSGFVHGDIMHLFVNMFVLFEFGSTIESNYIFHFGEVFGKVLFILTYLIIIVMADVPTYYKHKTDWRFSSVGASGGVSGILFIYILLYPWNLLGLFAIIPVPAIVFGVLYLWYSTWASKNQNSHIDHLAHFYGAIAGVTLAIISRPAIVLEFVDSLINNFPL
jgi:membrane associated rhomboid family serine protease